ncbi:MAG: thiol peroxidase [Bacilli bacterium]
MDITFAGNKVTLEGQQVSVGDQIKDFKVTGNDLGLKKLSDFDGVKVINVVPSLDTSVCDLQTKRFNETFKDSNVTILTISNDLPFAQSRWCGNSGLENVITLSDYLYHDFAAVFGTNLKEFGLQTRAVFVLDQSNTIKYVQYVSEVTDHPNYDDAIAVANSLV